MDIIGLQVEIISYVELSHLACVSVDYIITISCKLHRRWQCSVVFIILCVCVVAPTLTRVVFHF